MSDSTEQFRAAILAAGLTPPDEIQADGTLHRFSTSGKARDDSGWYVLHSDGIPAGAFGCWREGFTQQWCSKSPETIKANKAMLVDHLQRVAANDTVAEPQADPDRWCWPHSAAMNGQEPWTRYSTNWHGGRR